MNELIIHLSLNNVFVFLSEVMGKPRDQLCWKPDEWCTKVAMYKGKYSEIFDP